MAIESENSHQPTLASDQGTEAAALLGDFGFNIRLSAPLDKEGLPAAHREGVHVTDSQSSSERSGGLSDELDDFGFDISIPVKLTGRDLSSTQDVDRLMTFTSPVVVKKESEAKKLLEELGIDENLSDVHVPVEQSLVPPVCERTPLDDFESHLYPSASRTEVDIPPKSDIHVTPPTSENSNDTPSLLCNFAYNTNPSTYCTKIVSPPTQNLSPPTSGETSKARSLLDDFGFEVRPTVSCSDSDLSDTQKSSPPSLEEVDCHAQSLLDDFGFEAKPSVCLEGKESATASSMSPPISEDSTNAQNLLDGFGFEASATCTFNKPLPEQNSTVELLNTGTDNLLDDFGFEIDHISSAEKVPPHPEQNSLILIPTSLATSDSAQNLLDDFGFDVSPSAGKEASSAEKSSPHIPEQNGDAQNLMDDFGFDVSPLATCTEQEMQVENTSSSTSGNLLEDFGFCSNTPVPCLSDNLPHSQTVENLLTPPSSSSERSNNIAATSLLEDFGFETSSSNSCSDKARPTTDDVTDKKLPVSTSGGSKPVERDLPLIAFSDDVVLMWKKDEGSHTASPTDKDADLMPSPRGGEEYSPAAAKLDGTVIISESGMHTASPTDKDTDLMPSPCGGEEHSPTAAKLDGTVIIGESGVTSTAASIDGEVVQSHVEEREEEEEEKVERKKKSRLPAPSHQLTKCSSFLRSPVKCSQLEELKEQANTTFTKSDDPLSHCDPMPTCETPSDNGDYQIPPCSSDKLFSAVESRSGDDMLPRSGSQSLNSSISSEHSHASSISSSLSTASREEEKRGAKAGPSRKVGRKIPKPVSKSKPSIKPSLLPSKPAATGLSKTSGVISQMHPPSSRLMKPKSTSVKSSLLKPSDKKPSTTVAISRPHLPGATSKSSRLAKTATTTVNGRGKLGGQPQRSKLAAPAAIRKKGVDKENSAVPKRTPLTTSTPITSSGESDPPSRTPSKTVGSSGDGGGSNDTFTLSSAAATDASPPPADPPCTPRTRKGRRSFIPTPSQENRVLRAKQAREAGAFGGGEGPHSRVFRPRNGIGRSNSIKPLKSKGYTFGSGVADDLPRFGASKVVHSPVDKENRPATPHSQWSPIRRKKPANFEEACIQCTKKVKAI